MMQLWYVKCKDNPRKKYNSCFYTDWTSEYEDYDIYGLNDIINNLRKHPKLSKLIWISILSFPDWLAKEACYRRNRRYDRKYIPMQYVYTLSNNSWILTCDGILQKTQNVTFDDLPNDWTHPKDNYEHPILKAIEFGKNSQEKIAPPTKHRLNLLKQENWAQVYR